MRDLFADIASFVAVSSFIIVFLFWADQVPGVFK